jgi:hypothetical protein
LSERSCPHCGNALASGARRCTCGFNFAAEDTQIPAPAIVRSGAADPRQQEVVVAVKRQVAPNAAMLMECPACSARISKRAQSCPKCGRAPYEHCQICASRILANATPCPECGDPLPFGS